MQLITPSSGSLSLRLQDSHPLTSLHTATRRLILQKARHQPASLPAYDFLSVYGFRFSFTPLTGVLFAFPSRYFSAIGSSAVFSLGSWSTQLPAGFLVPRRTQVPHQKSSYVFRLRGSHALRQAFPCLSAIHTYTLGSSPCGPSTPLTSGLGSSNFARRYSRNLRRIASLLDFFSRVT